MLKCKRKISFFILLTLALSFFQLGSTNSFGLAAISIDGNISDWSGIPDVATSTSATGVKSMKAFSDETYLYFLVQGTAMKSNFDLAINVDNNANSGYIDSEFAESGIEYMIESNGELYYTGTNNWPTQSKGSTGITLFKSSTIKEIRIQKSVLTNLSNSITVGFMDMNYDWNVVSKLPTSGIMASYVLNTTIPTPTVTPTILPTSTPITTTPVVTTTPIATPTGTPATTPTSTPITTTPVVTTTPTSTPITTTPVVTTTPIATPTGTPATTPTPTSTPITTTPVATTSPISTPAGTPVATPTPFPDDKISDLKITTNGNEVILSWTPLNNSSIIGYHVYRRTTDLNYSNRPLSDFPLKYGFYEEVIDNASSIYNYVVKPLRSDYSLGVVSNEVSINTEASIINLKIGDMWMRVNGKPMEIDPGRGTAPIIKNQRTLIPLSALIKKMGGEIEWNEAEKKISINIHQKKIDLWIGKTTVVINNVSQTMDVAPIIENDRTYVPLRYVLESINCIVHWDPSQQITILIGSNHAKISGKFVLPESVNTFPTAAKLIIYALNKNGQSFEQAVELNAYQRAVDINLYVTLDKFMLKYNLFPNQGEIEDIGYYTSNGSVDRLTSENISVTAANIDGIIFPAIPLKYRVSGRIKLPEGEVAKEGGLEVVLSQYPWPENNATYSSVYSSVYGSVYNVNASTYNSNNPYNNYSIVIIIPKDSNYIDYSCWLKYSKNVIFAYELRNDERYIKAGFYADSSAEGIETATIFKTINNDIGNINITLAPSIRKISGKVMLPGSMVAPKGGLNFHLYFGDWPSENANTPFNKLISQRYITVLIPEGKSFVNYSVGVMKSASYKSNITFRVKVNDVQNESDSAYPTITYYYNETILKKNQEENSLINTLLTNVANVDFILPQNNYVYDPI